MVVGRAGPFAGDHGCTERSARGALLTKRGTFIRLERPAQNLTGAAQARFRLANRKITQSKGRIKPLIGRT